MLITIVAAAEAVDAGGEPNAAVKAVVALLVVAIAIRLAVFLARVALGLAAIAGAVFVISSFAWEIYQAVARVDGRSYGIDSLSIAAPFQAPNGDVWNRDNDGDGFVEPIYIEGYTRRDGTRVRGHYRRATPPQSTNSMDSPF